MFYLTFPQTVTNFQNFGFFIKKEFTKFRFTCNIKILQVNLNLNENRKTFLTSFPKFDIKYSAFHRKKMEKQNQKETRPDFYYFKKS